MGGDSALCGGVILAAGWSTQEEITGFKGDTGEAFADQMVRWAQGLGDEEIIRDFMRGSCKKIVAGGTSANIAARVLGRKIVTNLNFTDPAIPPTAQIRGIDLVTEGVLTINRALEILRKFCEQNGEVDLKELDADNGAAQMARMLIEDCTDLTMFIGKAINPAHQNPNLPMDLSIKMRLLNELADVMRKMGRRVEVNFY